MKFITLAVMALLGTTQGIKLKDMDMEADDQIAADVNAQVADTTDPAAATEAEAAAAADPQVMAQAQAAAEAEAAAATQASAGAAAASGSDASANQDPQYLAE